MKVFLLIIGLMLSSILLVDSDLTKDYILTFMRDECEQLNNQKPLDSLVATELSDSEALVFTRYSRIKKIRLQNSGGQRVIKCEAYRFPAGIVVTVSADGRTCEITGMPTTPQAQIEAYTVATNQRGSSLVIVPISVNALVLME